MTKDQALTTLITTPPTVLWDTLAVMLGTLMVICGCMAVYLLITKES